MGAWRDRHVVSGRASCRARVVKEAEVSPRPWRRMRTLVSWGDAGGGGVMVRWMEGGKSDWAGSRGAIVGTCYFVML